MIKTKIYIHKQLWSNNENEIVFSNSDNEIFVLNIENRELIKITANGENPMWLRPQNTIAYLTDKNTIKVYDLKDNKHIQSINVINHLFSTSSIDDYYWFADQQKILIKARYENRIIPYLLWKYSEIVYKYN